MNQSHSFLLVGEHIQMVDQHTFRNVKYYIGTTKGTYVNAQTH